MTYRLIGLMSVVLLLCLAAFAFLVDRYQDQVMDELARTVSEVGRETLRTAEVILRHDAAAAGAGGPHETEVVILARPPLPADGPGSAGARQVILKRRFEQRIEADVPAPDAAAPGALVFESELELCDPGAAGAACAAGPPRSSRIQLERLWVEREPGRGLLMRIPTAAGGGGPSGADVHLVALAAGGAGEIRLPISTRDYVDLYAAMRRRSVYMFVAVFLVGGLLSAGLAARFTRPIRRLDAGIRALSEGRLDVEVEVAGGDEIGRLGRAFNEMTRKLRAGRERARELTRREKQAALGRLAAGVAHDVRNPLHAIGLTLQHLQEVCRPQGDAPQREFDRSLGTIRDEIRRLDRLVANFLRFAGSERGARQPVDLGALLAETLHLVEKEAERRRVSTELAIEGLVPPLVADPEAVRASVLNLVLNAFEAMPDGGALRLVLAQRGSDVWLEVEDTGLGIPPEDHDRVFEFAYTTREGGHGLGLPMVQQVVVEDHGGRVLLDSRPGAGTRVSLVFPVGAA